MFLKQYKVKSNAPLKGSEIKKFRLRLEKAYPDHIVELQQLMPTKSNANVLKIVTNNDFQTNVYLVDKLPMFFELENGVIVPTIYTLWQIPNLLPYFTTLPAVFPKLANGADLMIPGVIPLGTGMNMFGHYPKNKVVGINLTSNKSALGVGYLIRSSDDLYMSGGHGAAVKILHLFGDKLWGHEPALARQVPEQKSVNLLKEDFPELGADTKKTSKPAPEIVETKQTLTNVVAENNVLSQEEIPKQDNHELNLEVSELSIAAEEENENIDAKQTNEELLKNAFLAALKNHGKSLQLPLLTSNFYRLYMVPEASQSIDLKKTKYKKLSNFLNEMIDQGFIVVREESKGVDKITSIDFAHPELVNFITDYKPPTVSTDSDVVDQPLFHSTLTETYTVTEDTAAFFTKLNYKRGEGIPATQVKRVIREYISKQGLPMADNLTKEILLDETLQQICDCQQATISKISSEIISRMDNCYQMISAKDLSANKPVIQMSLATRSGNKKVTLVSNIECYGIIVPEFIKLCKQGAAASTTIVKMPNHNREQLQIQGNQIRFVYNLLTQTYKVPPKCITGLELARDKKNKKK